MNEINFANSVDLIIYQFLLNKIKEGLEAKLKWMNRSPESILVHDKMAFVCFDASHPSQ